MNEEHQRILQELEKAGCIVPCKDVPFRTIQEKRSLQKCIRRPGYLGQYDTAIRFCFLWLLQRGYDMHPAKVHSVYRFMLEQLAGLSSAEAKEVVQVRHAIKYKEIEDGETQEVLKRALQMLRESTEVRGKNIMLQ